MFRKKYKNAWDRVIQNGMPMKDYTLFKKDLDLIDELIDEKELEHIKNLQIQYQTFEEFGQAVNEFLIILQLRTEKEEEKSEYHKMLDRRAEEDRNRRGHYQR